MMQRPFLLAFALLFSTLHLSAQVSLGLSAGLNAPMLHWKIPVGTLDYQPGLGPEISGLLQWQLSPAFSLRASGGFGVWRVRQETMITDANGKEFNVDLINAYRRFQGGLNLLAAPLSDKNVYLSAGIAYSRLINGRYHVRDSEDFGAEQSSGALSLEDGQINRNQWLADIGLGYRLTMGPGQVFAELHYQIHTAEFSAAPLVDAHLDALLLQLGYQLPLGK
jgi:hypothetical protein